MPTMMTDYSSNNPLVSAESVSGWLDQLPRPIALTGGTGFVGSHLVDTLCAAGIEPRVLVRDPSAPRWISGAPVQWVEGSLAERDSLRRLVEGAGSVIHLAGVVRAGREEDFDRGNRLGTRNLVSAVTLSAPSARLVHVSSLAAAGPSPDPGWRWTGGRSGTHFVVRPVQAQRRKRSPVNRRLTVVGYRAAAGDLWPPRYRRF